MRSLQTMGEAPRRQTTPRRTLLHAAARHDPFEQRALVYHEDVAESLDLGDSVCHEVDAIEIGDRLALVDVSAIVPEVCAVQESRKDRIRRIASSVAGCFPRLGSGAGAGP